MSSSASGGAVDKTSRSSGLLARIRRIGKTGGAGGGGDGADSEVSPASASPSSFSSSARLRQILALRASRAAHAAHAAMAQQPGRDAADMLAADRKNNEEEEETDGEDDVVVVPPIPDPAEVTDLERRIIRQVEYYFGDYNLPRDRFMQDTLEDNDGELSIIYTYCRQKTSFYYNLVSFSSSSSSPRLVSPARADDLPSPARPLRRRP